MTGRRMDQMVITKKVMDEDPNFASFSDVTNTAESDNSSSHNRPVITLESRAMILAQQMDNTNTTNLCRDDFNQVYHRMITRSHDFKADIEAAMKSSVSPETMTMQEIYLKMASMAHQKWDKEADEEARKDSDKSLALYLSAPKIRRKLERLKEDTKLFRFWHERVEKMPLPK